MTIIRGEKRVNSQGLELTTKRRARRRKLKTLGGLDIFKGETTTTRRKKFRKKPRVVENKNMDIRLYFKNLEKKIKVDNPAISPNYSENTKNTKNKTNQNVGLWKGGPKMKKFETNFETKTLKRSRTALGEEENQCKGKKKRENEDLIISQEEKMEIGKKRGEEGMKTEREKFRHTLMGRVKPEKNESDPKRSSKTEETLKTPSSSQPTIH